MASFDSWDYEEPDDAPRWLYAVGGALLVWLGLRRWSLPAAVVTGAGAFLLTRALPESRAASSAAGRGTANATPRPATTTGAAATPAAGNTVRDAFGSADYVDETSDESFPASDPPSWTPTTSVGPTHR